MKLAVGSAGPVPAPPGYELIFPWTGSGGAAEAAVCGCPWPVLLARLDEGELLGLALHGGEPVHRTLVQTRGRGSTGTGRWALPLREGEVYIHYCETDPAHRGKGLYPAMLRLAAARLAEAGYRTAYIACATDNAASVRGILKAGFRYAFTERAVVMLGGRIRLGVKRCQAEPRSRSV